MSPRTKKQAAAVRDAAQESIRAAALRVFTRRGYDGATMADVAKEAHVSYGLAYHYFRSKDALFAELVRTAYEASYRLFLQAREAPGAPMDKLRAIVEGILGPGIRGEGALYFQIVIQAVTLERVPKAVRGFNEKYLPLYSAILEELLSAGSRGTGSEDKKGAVAGFLALILGLPIVLERMPGSVTPQAATLMRLFGIYQGKVPPG